VYPFLFVAKIEQKLRNPTMIYLSVLGEDYCQFLNGDGHRVNRISISSKLQNKISALTVTIHFDILLLAKPTTDLRVSILSLGKNPRE
jgi:hypothetical protein